MANNTRYGLSAGIWTDKGSRSVRDVRSSCGPASSGPTPSTSSTRPRPFGGTASRASAARAAGRACAYLEYRPNEARGRARPTSCHRGRVRALRVGPRRARHAAPAATHLANAPPASRKDARDAVRAARGPRSAWARPHGLQPRPDPLPPGRGAGGPRRRAGRRVAASIGVSAGGARAEVEAAVDAAVHYAGWPDKLASVLGGVNQVARPYFALRVPEPVGVVALRAPTRRRAGRGRAGSAGDHGRQRGRRAGAERLPARRPRPGRGGRHLRRARRRGQPAGRPRAPSCCRGWPATPTWTPSSTPPATPSWSAAARPT